MKLLQYNYLLLIVVATLLVSCENVNWNLVNQGAVVGDAVGNTSTSEVDQYAGDRILSPEEIKRAKKGYDRAMLEILKPEASSNLIDGAFDIEWEKDITLGEFRKKFEKHLDPVHRDLVIILHLVYKKVPHFKFFQCARDIEQQKRNVAKGVSQTMKSKHLTRPVEACDLRSTRKAKPWVNGKKDVYDVEYLGYFQGLAEGFGMALSNFPCEVYASKVRRVMRWVTIRDLFHHEAVSRKECKNGYKTKYSKF